MRVPSFSLARTVALCLLVCAGASLAYGVAPQAAQQKVSDAERKAAQKINDAKEPAAKLQVAADFIQKYPKSTLRPKIVEVIVNQIDDVKDSAQKITLAESFLGAFSEAAEANRMYPILLEAYVGAKRIEDAFNAAGPWLEANPNEVDALFMLALVGTDEARMQNTKFVKQSEQYGLKAIELLEANKRPESITEEAWNKNKPTWLPKLYQSMGFLALVNGNNTEALVKLQKAVTLSPNDPFNYVMLGSAKNDDYTAAAKQAKAMPAGPARDTAEKKLAAQLDEVIELFAHAIGLMEGKPQYQPLRDQLMPDLTNYYKYRHNNSDAGLKELINKYKQPSAP